MKSLILLLVCFLSPVYAKAALPMQRLPKSAEPISIASAVKNELIKFDFQAVSVSHVIGLVYMEALKQPYVIDPAVLKDDRMVSFRFDASNGDLRAFWRLFMDSLGYAIVTQNSVDFVMIKKTEEKHEPEREIFFYRMKYRSLSYLVELLSPIFKAGSFAVNRSVRAPVGDKIAAGANAPVPAGSAASIIDQDSDMMMFQGSHEDVEKIKKILPQVDVAVGEVVVKAVLYEVTTSQTDGTAFSLALGLLGGKLGISIGGASELSNAITVKTGSIDAAFSALAGDSRFKVVSTPRLRVKSGAQARLTVGQDVPTLGAINYPQNGGQSSQSVEYRSSGVILSLSPVVRESAVDMTIDQQISDFAKTETGVNNSPTLTKRQLSTTVSVADGELVVIGGLTQDKDSKSQSGLSFLPKLMHSNSKNDSRTEILLLLQVSKIGT